MHANRGDDGSAILLHGQSFLFGGAEGDLLRAAVRRSLAPEMTLTFTVATKYIHDEPSGDQPAAVHPPSGPTGLGGEWPSREIRRHIDHHPSPFISTTKAVLRSGEANE